ncbi:MAG TPA: radical SAM family heme chaperone HemW [Bacteroidales bacterium]|nr:radical SAM family heme chaperone HemW [Bacteroidales bacterium]
MAGIYIHFPFCARFCIYCDFYSTKRTGEISQFADALCGEIKVRSDFFKKLGVPVTTLYVGGGTPSLMPAGSLSVVFRELKDTFSIESIESLDEVTMEVNPDDVTPSYLHSLRELGVTRISMGVQSFIDSHLVWMNRRHDSSKAVEAFNTAREAGFDNISIDLIFGFDGLSDEEWNYNLDRAIGLRPEHISSYQLSIEPKTKLGRQYEKGVYNALSDEVSLRQYSTLQKKLANAGYEQYEISSFCLPGREAKHNSSYWNRTPYLGLGPSAHSFDGVKRFWNEPSLTKYLRAYQQGDGGEHGDVLTNETPGQSGTVVKVVHSEILKKKDHFNETIMLSLRRADGMNPNELRAAFSEEMCSEFEKSVAVQLKKGNLIMDGDKIRIPSGLLFLSDGIIRDLIL